MMSTEQVAILMKEYAKERLDVENQVKKLIVKTSVIKQYLQEENISTLMKQSLEASFEKLTSEELDLRRDCLVLDLTIASLQNSLTNMADPRYDTMH